MTSLRTGKGRNRSIPDRDKTAVATRSYFAYDEQLTPQNHMHTHGGVETNALILGELLYRVNSKRF